MGCKSICDTCLHRWSRAGKRFCTIEGRPNCKYVVGKKACDYYKEGHNDKTFRGKNGENRTGRSW